MNYQVYLCEIIRCLIGFVFFTAAWSKTSDYEQFTKSLTNSFHIPDKSINWIAPFIIVIEWSLSIALILQLMHVKLFMQLALILFILFTSTIVFLLFYQGKVKCSCFGEEQRPVSHIDVIRNILFIAAIIFYLARSTENMSIFIEFNSSILITILAIMLTIVSINLHDVVRLLMLRKNS